MIPGLLVPLMNCLRGQIIRCTSGNGARSYLIRVWGIRKDKSKDFRMDILSLNLNKSKMEQVFLNLFINAIDAMPGGGQLRVRTYNEEITEVSEEVDDGEDILR